MPLFLIEPVQIAFVLIAARGFPDSQPLCCSPLTTDRLSHDRQVLPKPAPLERGRIA
jgi:hypothetical protein